MMVVSDSLVADQRRQTPFALISKAAPVPGLGSGLLITTVDY